MEEYKKEDKKKLDKKKQEAKAWLAPIVSVLGAVVLYGLMTLTAREADILSEDRRIGREGYGGEEQEYQIWVEGIEEQAVPVTVTVGPQVYTEQEAETVFARIMDGMENRIRADNPSLMEVRSNLNLPSRIEDGVSLRWYSSEPDVMDSSGRLGEEVETEQPVILYLELLAGEYRQDYEIPVRVLPPDRSKEEQRLTDFLKELGRLNERQKEEPWLTLPESFEGKALSYHTKERSGYEPLLLLGVIMAVLFIWKEKSGVKQESQKRQRELLLDYADLLSKLMVLICAGLTVRNAWERMVKEYEWALEQKKQRPRAAYEEMRYTYYQMQSGMAEGDAYREFGRRCRLQSYLKLSGLLEQNRRSGTKNMKAILETEMADALEQRKNLARRLGEEAGTRLLMPLFLMLSIVMVMIMVPAMMTMG